LSIYEIFIKLKDRETFSYMYCAIKFANDDQAFDTSYGSA